MLTLKLAIALVPALPTSVPAAAPRADTLSASAYLAMLPDGEEKRRFITDCTGCHQWDASHAFTTGRARTDAEWRVVLARMIGMAGAHTGFPVISAYRDSVATAAWLARHYRDPAAAKPVAMPALGRAEIREYPLSTATDLPHDVAVDGEGQVIVTGMFTHRMIVLDPATGQTTTVPIPHPNANPRAVEIDAAGRWWVALGGPRRVARYDPARGPAGWRVWNAGMYAHSVALAPDGRAWVNGHFTRSPELIAAVDTSGDSVRTVALPSHPTLAQADGGPIPYEIRVAPDGVVWTSELQGNRLVGHDPRTGTSTVIEMPRPHMAPRRFDIDARGILWVPSYSGNAIVRIDPRALGASRTREYALPIADALPYVVRVHPRTGLLWIGTAAADAVLTLDPRTGAFTTYRVPSRGALVRHMAIDSRTGDVWLAYGASPGPLSSRVARVRIAP